MLVQAAKIIGSGLATIGLTSQLLSLITTNRQYLLANVVYNKIAKKAINNLDLMISKLPNNSIIIKFLEEEIPKSKLKINGSVINNNLYIKDFIHLSSNDRDEKLEQLLNIDFLTAGVYTFISPNNERYLSSTINFDEWLYKNGCQLNYRGKPRELDVNSYKYIQYKWSPYYMTTNYYNLFKSKYPKYKLKYAEYNILMGFSELLPRILEQSLFYGFPISSFKKYDRVKFIYANRYVRNIPKNQRASKKFIKKQIDLGI